MKSFCIVFFSFLFVNTFWAQNTWEIKSFESEKCAKCSKIMNDLPLEVGLAVKRDNNSLFVVCNNKEWFDKLFDDGVEAFCIELVRRDQFACYSENLYWSKPIAQGVLMEPCYKRDFKKRTVVDKMGGVKIQAGTVPNDLIGKDLEYNIILLNDKVACWRRLHYNIDSYLWDLLDMGMYMDTISYKSKGLNSQQTYIRNKTITFTVPFQKGKSEYQHNDIKALYDSLNITDFDITKMSIRAYSSVEGTEEKNLELQEKRAQSISKALQSYQKTNIITDITSAENWVEFMNDINQTTFAPFGGLQKQEIKTKLQNKETLEALEPILEKHRKAIITIDLEQKNSMQSMSNEQLTSAFKKSIDEKNMANALSIQKQIFQRISEKTSPNSLLSKLEIPQKKEYADLLSNNNIFDYWYANEAPYQTLLDFEKLDALSPKNGHIKYNICVVKFKIWQLSKDIVDPVRFLKEINDLKLYGVDQKLIKRMLVNYNILLCEMYMLKGDFQNKDKCLAFIVSNYKSIPYNPQDIINLAQYLVAYAKYDAAIKVLAPYIKQLDCDENLLFYYINLTIVKDEFTKKADFRNVLLNAYSVNPKRFCKLFNSYDKGGVTFQLLLNDYLKSSYCENCNN